MRSDQNILPKIAKFAIKNDQKTTSKLTNITNKITYI